MPLVHIDLIEGRSPEQLKAMVKEVTDAISKNTGAPAEHIHIVLNEMPKNHYSVGGVLASDN
ncbi:2-hydroxymuconate tautomerase [Companilactobacillus mishanensis]|uniref:Tautomerase n=1 Tax=Companilactobacillus mishanensis TaxID=2486008 RepID=A0A5P0ZF23_9LACO|nr:2-hydroxymuconate tautomerase [Companilactobacillus mishanensis]MQS44309.1 4-oxalocrotonate tautomerase [Companilactobacillus mishanensis]MQS51589.1 4-oxalocrotonate tautomerase [Companilactobacillus mishanensis]MQS88550.1 4-oxalocrotonate tautomerase [Companilactobacillus mishanensis]